jgi:hypothetical protein
LLADLAGVPAVPPKIRTHHFAGRKRSHRPTRPRHRTRRSLASGPTASH